MAKIVDLDFGSIYDDEGNKILPHYLENNHISEMRLNRTTNSVYEELVYSLEEMSSRFRSLPVEASLSPISHSDFSAFLELLSAIFKEL